MDKKTAQVDERGERIIKRSTNPKNDIINYLETHNFDEVINQHKEYVKQMIASPVNAYLEFKNRLENYGCEASFPEFEGLIGYLIKALFQNIIIYNWFKQENRYILLEQVIHKIIGLSIEGRFNYPYSSTIYAVEDLLELLDYYYRSTNDKSKEEGLHVSEKIGPYYHIFRYRSYMTTFLCSKEYGIPNNIIFPTCANISATNLISLRCVPILIMGVIDKPIYVDQYLNTPLDFWAHDIQHSKRQIQETERYYDVFIKHNNYYKRRTLYDIKSPIDFYKYMENFTKTQILPMIDIKTFDSTEKKAFKSIKRLIIFEVVHEKAWPITQPSLCRNISLRYDEFPVENIQLDKDSKKISTFHYLFSDPTTIGNVISKLRHGFYDKSKDPKDYIVPKNYRTSANVAICAREIMTDLKCSKVPNSNFFISLTTDKHALQEFKDLPSIDTPDNPTDEQPYEQQYQDNLYSDIDLFTKFSPVANPEDVELQESLHKKTTVEGYDPNIFEPTLGGKNRIKKHRTKKHNKNKYSKKTRYFRGKKSV